MTPHTEALAMAFEQTPIPPCTPGSHETYCLDVVALALSLLAVDRGRERAAAYPGIPPAKRLRAVLRAMR